MFENKYGNMIYELTVEEEAMVNEHHLFYRELFYFGNRVLEVGFEKNDMPDYKLTIFSNLYRVLELLDTIMVMTDNGLINSGLMIARSLFEASAQLCYIISDPEENVEKRAILLQLFDIKRDSDNIQKFSEEMKKYSCYKKLVDIVTQDRKYDNWYSYCEGNKTSFAKLCKKIGWFELHEELYKMLCIEIHQVNHMETNIVCKGRKFVFKPFRMFENHVFLIIAILRIVAPMYTQLISKYGDAKLKSEWQSYESRLREYIEKNIAVLSDVNIMVVSLKRLKLNHR